LAQANLGAMADEGVGMAKNEEMAAIYWMKASGKGVPQAFFNLGLYHETGQGKQEKSSMKAVKCYQQAAGRGYGTAYVNLGVIYEEGRDDVKEDIEFAIRCYKEAANKGIAHAAYNLGNIYYEGRNGVSPDVKEANKYFQLAKELKFPHSIRKLRWQRWFQQNWFWIAGIFALTIQHIIIWLTVSLFWSIAALIIPLTLGMGAAFVASRRK
jgi:TPR repeat protein